MAKTLFTITTESTASEIHDALLSLALDNQSGRYKHHELQELFNRDALEADIELVLNEDDYKCLDSSDSLTMDDLITYVEEYVDYDEYNDQMRDAIDEFVDRKEELEYIKAEANHNE